LVQTFLHRQPPAVTARVPATLVQRCGSHPCPLTGCATEHEAGEPDGVFRSAHVGAPVASLHSAQEVAKTPGHALPGALARMLGTTLGHDFSHVRVHHDTLAAASAAHYASDAYTYGSHVVFGAGQYQPDSPSGRQLLVHELTHVVQARNGGGGGSAGVSAPTDASEQEATRIADTHGWAGGTSVGATPSAAVQRQARTGGQSPASVPVNVPAEKWSETLEAAYRRSGDFRRAAAIRMCREQRPGACNLVLTQSEVQRLYDLAQSARGNEQRVRDEAPRIVPALLLLGPMPSTAVQAGTGATTGISMGAVAAGGVVAIVAICVIAGIQLWRLGSFQQELEAQGFIILDDPLAVCIRGCHTSPVPVPQFREFPDLPPELELRPRPFSPSERERLRRWIERQPTRRTEEQPRPEPRLRPGDPDVEDEERRGCRGTATYPRGGNTCHDQFATSVSGVTREWLLITPIGLEESFDARGRDGRTLYEMKTGYGFLGIRNPTLRQRDMIEEVRQRWVEQSSMQQLVADLCGYDLVWYFSNRAAKEWADGVIEPRTVYMPFRCDTDGERRRR
jgi:uncharacterized protein DUF4157